MMLYVFVKDASGNVQAIGVDTEFNQAIQDAVKPFSDDGCQLSDFASYEAQSVGAVNKQLEAATEKINAAIVALGGTVQGSQS